MICSFNVASFMRFFSQGWLYFKGFTFLIIWFLSYFDLGVHIYFISESDAFDILFIKPTKEIYVFFYSDSMFSSLKAVTVFLSQLMCDNCFVDHIPPPTEVINGDTKIVTEFKRNEEGKLLKVNVRIENSIVYRALKMWQTELNIFFTIHWLQLHQTLDCLVEYLARFLYNCILHYLYSYLKRIRKQ